MIILFAAFVLQFSVSCACLALREDQQVGFHSRSDSVLLLEVTVATVSASPEPPAGGGLEQVGGHSEGRGEEPELLRLLRLLRQRLLRRGESDPRFLRGPTVRLSRFWFSFRPPGVPPQLALLPHLFQHRAEIRGGGSEVPGRNRTLLQLHRGGWGGGRVHADLSPAWL